MNRVPVGKPGSAVKLTMLSGHEALARNTMKIALCVLTLWVLASLAMLRNASDLRSCKLRFNHKNPSRAKTSRELNEGVLLMY